MTFEELVRHCREWYPELGFLGDVDLLVECQDRLLDLAELHPLELEEFEKEKIKVLPALLEFLG